MTGFPVGGSARFGSVVAGVFIVAATIALPDVFLRVEPAAPPPVGVFAASPARLHEPLCADSYCFVARETMVVSRNGDVDWVINPSNPLTQLPVDAEGRSEDVEIVAVAVAEGNVHLELASGRVVSRARDGVWRPGVAEFREVRGEAALIAALAAALVVATGWARSRRIDDAVVVVAGLCGALAHLPITIWRHTTRYSLSMAGAMTIGILALSVVAAYLVAGPRPVDMTVPRYVPSRLSS